MEQINEKTEIFVCDCHSREHQIVFEYELDDNMVYCHIHLCSSHSFFERLKRGIRYIFGHKCRYGHWDEFVWRVEHAEKLEELAKLLRKNNR